MNLAPPLHPHACDSDGFSSLTRVWPLLPKLSPISGSHPCQSIMHCRDSDFSNAQLPYLNPPGVPTSCCVKADFLSMAFKALPNMALGSVHPFKLSMLQIHQCVSFEPEYTTDFHHHRCKPPHMSNKESLDQRCEASCLRSSKPLQSRVNTRPPIPH